MNTTCTAGGPSDPPTILERLSRGEAQAFDDFVAQYGRLVAFHVRRSLGWHASDIDDATQDAMLAVWRAAPQFDRSRGAESTFVGTIVRRLMINRLRKARVRATICGSALISPELLHAQPDRAPALVDSEQAHRLHGALDRLQPQDRELVELAIIGGKTTAQIAEATGLAPNRVARNIRCALARLRKEITARRAAA